MSKSKKLSEMLLQNATIQKELSEDAIKQQLTIVEELRMLIPPLKTEEYQQLEANLLKEGCREPLLYWFDDDTQQYVLIDGHNRYAICKKNNLSFHLKALSFKNEDEVKLWMVTNQLGRRNLTPEQQSYFRGKQYEMQKNLISNPFGRKGNPLEMVVKMTTDINSGQNEHQLVTDKTAEILAKTHNVGEKTIRRDALFAKGLDRVGEGNPTLKQEILSGKAKVKKETLQQLGSLEAYETIKNIDDITKQTNSKNSPTLFKNALLKGGDEVKVNITGEWLIKYGLVEYWLEIHGNNITISNESIFVLTWEDLKKLLR